MPVLTTPHEKRSSPGFQPRIAGLLLLVAFVLRVANLDKFDVQYDEWITRGVVDNIFRHDLRNNWKYANVPANYRVNMYNFSSYFYFDAVMVRTLYFIADPPPEHPVRWDRLVSAITGDLALLLFYLLALAWFDGSTALIFLALLTVAPLLIQDAHYARPEAFELMLVAILYLLSSRLRQGRFRYSVLALACACVGFLGATKFSLLPIIGVVLLWIPGELWKQPLSAARIVALTIGATALGMFIGVPDAFFHPDAYFSGVHTLLSQYSGVHIPHGNLQGGNTFRMAGAYLWQTVGPPATLLAGVGAIALLVEKRILVWASLCLPTLFYFAAFSMQSTFFERNLSHIVPLLLMLSAAGLTAIVDYACTRTMSRAIPALLAAGLFISAIALPAFLSAKLVFVALPSTTDARAKKYEEDLQRKTGMVILSGRALDSAEDVTRLTGMAEDVGRSVLVRVLDYNDPFTAYNVGKLAQRIWLEQVGYFPGLFTNLPVSTLNVYHSPAFRYLLLHPPPAAREAVIGGWRFAAPADAFYEIDPGRIETGSWVRNGCSPGFLAPRSPGLYFGSYTSERGDQNTGTLRMGPFSPGDGFMLGIPIATGPDTKRLSITLTDHRSGRVIARLSPPPMLAAWKLWKVDLPHANKTSFDLVASDQGEGWGEWLAVGTPRAVSDIFFTKFGAISAALPEAPVTINGAWTRDGYYPATGPPPIAGLVYGSWSGEDSNVGSLRMGPLRAGRQTVIGIPLVTGPNSGGLSIQVLNAATGQVIAALNPPPVHVTWWVWKVVLPGPDTSIEIVAHDAGTDYGQWLAFAQPHVLLTE
jgi:hypothetical protein